MPDSAKETWDFVKRSGFQRETRTRQIRRLAGWGVMYTRTI